MASADEGHARGVTAASTRLRLKPQIVKLGAAHCQFRRGTPSSPAMRTVEPSDAHRQAQRSTPPHPTMCTEHLSPALGLELRPKHLNPILTTGAPS